jgi:hypothetical protein
VNARGDGVGIEITRSVVRAVRMAREEPGHVVGAAEAPVSRFEDDAAVLDALIRVHGQLGESDAPTRVAWFPDGATMQRLDATGRSGPELNAMRHELVQSGGITSTMLVELDVRRWMLALRWDHQAAQRLEHLVERAGFVDASVEPAPVTLGRVVPSTTVVARRDAADDQSWVAIYDVGVPLAAGNVPQASREFPDLALAAHVTGTHRLDDILGGPELAETVDGMASAALATAGRSGELALGLMVAGSPYPPFPAHDLRAPQRQCVALGAAAGAAGLAGRLRPVDVLAPTTSAPPSMRRPWAIEQVVELPPPVRARRRPWWRRGSGLVTGGRRPS